MERLSKFIDTEKKALQEKQQRIKVCPVCKKPIKGYKKHTSLDKKISISVPVFACNCKQKIIDDREVGEKQQRIDLLIQNCNIDAEFLNNDFKVYHSKLIRYYEDLMWVKLGWQLLLYEDPGNHKTGQATAIAKKAMYERQWSCLYYRADELPQLCKKDSTYEYKASHCKILILDNFAKEASEKLGGFNFRILDKRIHNHRSSILILNFKDDSRVIEVYGPAMASRLKAFKQIPVLAEKSGQDQREKIKYGRNPNGKEEKQNRKI